MDDQTTQPLEDYYREAETWSADREAQRERSQRTAWIIAGGAALIAVLEAFALIMLVPLKSVEPYTLMVDKQTGYVQALKPLDQDKLTADAALTRSFLVQYVIARESFDIDGLNADYRKVALWSAGEARDGYVNAMQASNPASPLVSLPRRTTIQTQVRSVSSLGADSAMVRFATIRTDPGGRAQVPQLWAAVIKYRFSEASMSAEDRFTNPLGFQVLRYRRDAEIETMQPAPVLAAPIDDTLPAPAATGLPQPAPGLTP